MSIKDLIKRLPLAVESHRKIDNFKRIIHIKKKFDLKSHKQGKQIQYTLIAIQKELTESDQYWVEKIESQRERLLKNNGPLIDGDFGEPGLYDNGVSVKEACLVSKPAKPSLMLFLLARSLKGFNVLELGTNVGISSAFIGAGLKASGKNGRVTTLDSSPYRQQLAKEVHSNLGLDNVTYVTGLFTDTLTKTLQDLGTIDLAFIDGHHQEQPTLDYFEEILKFTSNDAVFVFDDIRWSEGMKKAWSRLQTDERLGLVIDLGSVGICTLKQQENPNRFVSDKINVF